MLTTVYSMSLNGIDGNLINVEVDVSNGLPSWEIVGLPDASIRESKERVRTAIKNSGYELHSRKIVINLAPASTKKEGSAFDLAIAIGILKNLGEINATDLKAFIFLGELCLDGKINGVKGVLSMCIEAKRLGIKNIIVPDDNKEEAGIIDGVNVYPVRSLEEVVLFLNKDIELLKYVTKFDNNVEIENEIDFKDVKGQAVAKRAMEIVAAGGHNCLMVGSPGTGKTMLANRVVTILPDLEFEESIEVTKVYSTLGLLNEKNALITKVPFRNPHHTISKTGLVGGGVIPKPGEISLAHNGVLFLDEIAEFDKQILELLRIPLEEREIRISRLNSAVKFPSKFIFIASMNPCPCGFLLDKKHKCVCTESQIQKYKNKISGPLLDRIDIHIEMSSVEYKDLNENKRAETSEEIRRRVVRAREVQMNRYKEEGVFVNSELNESLVKKYCCLDETSNKLLEKAYEQYSLSARSVNKILKVARTIADLAGCENIEITHLAEAIQYRVNDKKYEK